MGQNYHFTIRRHFFTNFLLYNFIKKHNLFFLDDESPRKDFFLDPGFDLMMELVFREQFMLMTCYEIVVIACLKLCNNAGNNNNKLLENIK